MYEYYIAHMEMHHFDIFTIEDIDKAFEEISPMNVRLVFDLSLLIRRKTSTSKLAHMKFCVRCYSRRCRGSRTYHSAEPLRGMAQA